MQEDGEVQEEDWTVLTVFPADRMKICVPVREQEILSVREGQKALVEVNAVPGTQLEGVVRPRWGPRLSMQEEPLSIWRR